MTKHTNKLLLAVVAGLAIAWLSAELRVRDVEARFSEVRLSEFSVEARDIVTEELLQIVIGPPVQEGGLPLLDISSPDGKRMRILFASNTSLPFRISSPGYVAETVTLDRHSKSNAIVRLKKI